MIWNKSDPVHRCYGGSICFECSENYCCNYERCKYEDYYKDCPLIYDDEFEDEDDDYILTN